MVIDVGVVTALIVIDVVGAAFCVVGVIAGVAEYNLITIFPRDLVVAFAPEFNLWKIHIVVQVIITAEDCKTRVDIGERGAVSKFNILNTFIVVIKVVQNTNLTVIIIDI